MKNREIKFRGKRVDNGEWIIGDLMQNYIHHEGFLTIVYGGCVYYKVIPKTVGQFTGITDKNGVEVYEGDVVSDGYFKGEIVFGKIGYDGKYNGFTGFALKKWYDDGSNCYELDYIFNPNDMEVLGNLYENPELCT